LLIFKEAIVARCELTGKSPVVKNLVSHSNIKTKFKAIPNVQKKRIFSNALAEFVTLRIAASTIRSLEHSGGFDKFILNQDEDTMSSRALTVKRRIVRKIKAKKATAGAAKTAAAAEKAPASAAKTTVAKTAKKK
jgi:large subunit ribosomal protein L28